MIRVFNTMSRKKEIFEPLKDKKVKLFVCGPTVYDYSHMGHAKTYVQFDVIVKYLRYRGYDVFYLQNITDLDDKIILRAKEMNVTPKELAEKFEKEYHKDMASLGVDSVTKFARATDFIEQIKSQVQRLIEKGFAYQIEDGIYYDLSKFKEYGKLSGRTYLEAEDSVSRIDESKNKRNRGDFCLWKFSKPGEPKWPSPWGDGRPGWHIEDTAITENFFGPQYDVHGGARDLIFPHHEAEIAQMEAISGKPLVKYWLHTGFLNVEGRKMAKSLGNFITIREALKKWGKETLRFFFISTHYRSPIDFNEKAVKNCEKAVERLSDFFMRMEEIIEMKKQDEKDVSDLVERARKDFEKWMDDDFNTPQALAVIFELVKNVNKGIDKIGSEGAKKIQSFLNDVNKIFGIIKKRKEELTEEERKLIEEREKARKEKDYKKADEIREKLKKMGIILEDTPNGVRWKKIKNL